MARKAEASRISKEGRLGKLPPQYNFFLNPYVDARFSTACPVCGGKIRQRKLPLAIHVEEWGIVALNKTCRYCPGCDLLIAHQDEIEHILTQLFVEIAPEVVGNDYLVVGTVERKPWRRGMTDPLSSDAMRDALHDFKAYRLYELAPRRDCSGTKSGPAPR